MRQALAAPERNTMFNKKDKDPIEPLEGEEVKKKGFPAFGRKKEKDPAAKIVTPEKRRRQLSWLCGACAAVAVGSLAFAAVEFTVAQDTVAKSQADMVEIVVPKETIKAGTPITADMLEEAQVPKRYVPADAPMVEQVRSYRQGSRRRLVEGCADFHGHRAGFVQPVVHLARARFRPCRANLLSRCRCQHVAAAQAG